ncbi:MAG: hypothetical protein LBB85_00950 [Dysgonamonadaceae bacterium]|nr:hypothetical protein [Dysgonamonadaceae bacterium]
MELKKVKGGGTHDTIKEQPREETVVEAACNNLLEGSFCKMGWSGGTVTGQCVPKGNNKSYCKT